MRMEKSISPLYFVKTDLCGTEKDKMYDIERQKMFNISTQQCG
jgi:predicted nucleic-acid-binding Zn-ribbon protein